MYNMNISVVIPAYNEEKRIEPTLKKVTDYLKSNFKNYEIIVVDDASSDNTVGVAEKYKDRKVKIIKNRKNMGKGFSVRRGILNAKFPLVLFTDSDLATPIAELKKLIAFITDYDVVIASRNMKESDVKTKQSALRVVLGKTFPLLVKIIALRGLEDTQCGFKLFRTSAAKKIFAKQRLYRFSFDVEILFIAKKRGYKIKEVPVVWIDKKGSKVNIVKDSSRMLFDLFKIRINSLMGKYNEK